MSEMARAISDAGVELPGVNGEASTAAGFAGSWTERRKSAAVPFQAQRLYEALDIRPTTEDRGSVRRAGREDRDLLIKWVGDFYTEIGEETAYRDKFVDAGLEAGTFWLLEHGGEPVSLAVTSQSAAGVVRLRLGFTPRRLRNSGFGGSCIGAVTGCMAGKGYRCTLFTDLDNPASNAAFRRVGYRAVAEWLRYRFTSLGPVERQHRHGSRPAARRAPGGEHAPPGGTLPLRSPPRKTTLAD